MRLVLYESLPPFLSYLRMPPKRLMRLVFMQFSILQFFNATAYPDNIKTVTLPIALLAHAMATELPVCEETATGLRKLLEAQDCFVRAAILRTANTAEEELNLDE